MSYELSFKVGNARLIIMENYEALGRYVAAKEQAEKFAGEMFGAVNNLNTMVARIIAGRSVGSVEQYFDVAKGHELVEKIREAQENMRTAATEANIHAEACGKPKLNIPRV